MITATYQNRTVIVDGILGRSCRIIDGDKEAVILFELLRDVKENGEMFERREGKARDLQLRRRQSDIKTCRACGGTGVDHYSDNDPCSVCGSTGVIGNIVGTISRAAEISLDANGEFRQPYSSYPRRKSSVMSTQEAEYMFGDDWRDLDF